MISADWRSITDNSTTYALKYFCICVNFINLWLKSLEDTFVCSFRVYSKNMDKLFNKIATTMLGKTYQYIKKRAVYYDLNWIK